MIVSIDQSAVASLKAIRKWMDRNFGWAATDGDALIFTLKTLGNIDYELLEYYASYKIMRRSYQFIVPSRHNDYFKERVGHLTKGYRHTVILGMLILYRAATLPQDTEKKGRLKIKPPILKVKDSKKFRSHLFDRPFGKAGPRRANRQSIER